MLLKERFDFNARPDDMYTIIDVMEAKYGAESREYGETMDYFQELCATPLASLGYNELMAHAKKLLATPVYRGGQKGVGSGTKKLPEPMTVLRKFAYLSSAINFMVKKGIPLENHCLKVVAYLRDLHKQKKDKKNGTKDD